LIVVVEVIWVYYLVVEVGDLIVVFDGRDECFFGFVVV